MPLLRTLVAASLALCGLSACGGHTPPPKPWPDVTGTLVTTHTLRFIDVKPGSGPEAVVGKCVFTHYTGWLEKQQRQVESSHDLNPDGSPGEPVGFLLGAREVIAGWDAGFQGMRVGGQRRLFVPWRFAYGASGRAPSIPTHADLVFDVEVLAVVDSLPHPTVSKSSVAASTPPHTCPTWRALNHP